MKAGTYWTSKEIFGGNMAGHYSIEKAGNGATLAIVTNYPGNQTKANAALIAAAPELLEALKNLTRRIERDNLHTTHGVSLAAARAAIAKATGQQ